MRLIDIQLKNFRTHADTPLSFPERGSIGLVGPNESGKSSVPEAIRWALYGGDALRGVMDGVRWHHAPPRSPAEVTLDFELNGRHYRIWRSENTARMSEVKDDGSEAVLAEKTSPVTEAATQLLGMSREEADTTFFCLQKDLDRLQQKGPTERVAFVREVLQMGQIDVALENAREDANAEGRRLEGMRAVTRSPDSVRPKLESATEDAAATESQLDAARKAAKESAERLEEAERTANDLRSRHEGARSTLRAIKGKKEQVADVEGKLPSLRGRVTRIENAQDEARNHRDELEALPAIEAAVKRHQERKDASEGLVEARASHEVAKDRLREAEKRCRVAKVQLEHKEEEAARAPDLYREVERVEQKLSKLTDARESSLREAQAALATASKEARITRRKIDVIEEAGREAECPTCLRALRDTFDTVLEDLRDALGDAERREGAASAAVAEHEEASEKEQQVAETLRKLKAEHSKAVHAKSGLKEARDYAKSAEENLLSAQTQEADLDDKVETLSDVPDPDPEAHETARERLNSLRALERKVIALETEAGRLDEARADLREAEDTLKGLQDEAEELRHQFASYKVDIESVNRAIMEATDAHKAAAKQAREDAASVARLEERLESAHRSIKEAQEDLASIEKEREHLGALEESYRHSKAVCARLEDFRVSVAATIRPELEELASGFLQYLTDGRHEAMELTEMFEPVVYEGGLPMDVISGGAEDVVALSIRLALSQMVAVRAGHERSLLILDEPFGALDETRRGNVVNTIQRLSTIFQQTIVISHVAETRDAVDHVFEFDKLPGENHTRILETS